ncbi:tryptophan synthase subunit alpha, partial [Vitellibacter sp. q18]|nr:tryptophan synthase subunit alpha [Aequorivita lutea]
LYAVTVKGTTGTRIFYENEVNTYLQKLKEQSDVPVLAGFGVSTSEQAQALASCCDGVVVGSKIVELFNEHQTDEIKKLIGESL